MPARTLTGEGRVELDASAAALWQALLDPAVLRELIPGADRVERPADDRFEADLSYGVGRFRSRYGAELRLDREERPRILELSGSSAGPLGRGEARALVTLGDTGPGRCAVAWRYEGRVSGPVALAGMALLNAAATRFVDRFFRELSLRSTGLEARAEVPYPEP